MSQLSLSSIFIYPLKSCAGLALSEAGTDASGLMGDRRFMLIDAKGRFMTARNCYKLLKITARLTGSAVIFASEGETELEIELSPPAKEKLRTKVWSDELFPSAVSKAADDWFSRVLGIECRLVAAPGAQRSNSTVRPGIPPESFADSAPLLVVTAESVRDLNARLTSTAGVERFRPNLVVKGSVKPYAEDEWNRIRLGGALLKRLGPCGRCTLTTVDAETLLRNPENEPLTTLKKYRFIGGEIIFGSYYQVIEPGSFQIGAEVTVID